MKNTVSLCLVAVSLMAGAAYAQTPAKTAPVKAAPKMTAKPAMHHHKATKKVATHKVTKAAPKVTAKTAAPAPAKKKS